MKDLKAYFVSRIDSKKGIAIVSTSSEMALHLARENDKYGILSLDNNQITCRLKGKIDTQNFKDGDILYIILKSEPREYTCNCGLLKKQYKEWVENKQKEMQRKQKEVWDDKNQPK